MRNKMLATYNPVGKKAFREVKLENRNNFQIKTPALSPQFTVSLDASIPPDAFKVLKTKETSSATEAHHDFITNHQNIIPQIWIDMVTPTMKQ